MSLHLSRISPEWKEIKIFPSSICNKTYFKPDSSEYQQSLNEQLDWLTVDHDDLRQDLSERISTPKYHPSMAIIDQWEQEAIANIQYTAFLARRELIVALDKHAIEIESKLNMLTPELRAARQYRKDFTENDIRKWSNALQELKKVPLFPATINNEDSIHELTIDLRRHPRISRSSSTFDETTSNILVPIIRSPTFSTTTFNDFGLGSKSTTINNNTKKKHKTVKFDDNSTDRLEKNAIGKVIIIRD